MSGAGRLQSHPGITQDDQPNFLTEFLAPWPCARPGAPGQDRLVSPQASLSGAGSHHGGGGGAATSGGERPGLGWGGGRARGMGLLLRGMRGR